MFQSILGNVQSLFKGANRQYQINNFEVTEEELLSEGGYAYIYRVHETQNTSKKYALKKIRIAVSGLG
jgi:hypothetical protein